MIDFKKIEEKWQKKWEKEKIFEVNIDKKKEKFFITVPYPYVNGPPHLGHAYSFLRGDVYARFVRMKGYNVLFPQGFHATGEPIVGVVDRLKKGDLEQKEILKLLGMNDVDIKEFEIKGPEFVAEYWKNKWIDIVKKIGYSVDWRRTFITAIDSNYNKFIQWQYRMLKNSGYVVQGTHPVIWCPNDQSPTGDHDRLIGEGESPTEFIVIKFELDNGEVMPCATLRPETVYGVTNIWINPNSEYVKAKIEDQKWIISKDAVEKISEQLHKVEIICNVNIENYIGKNVRNPVTSKKIPILPSNFVDIKKATGVVMSVPAHAPFDYVGLSNLKNGKEFSKFNLKSILNNIIPISVIKSELGKIPAIDYVKKMKISNQSEKAKLDEITNLIYKKEFHTGILINCRKFSKMKVSEVKEKIQKDFLEDGFATLFYEIMNDVVCRCNTRCYVKILENQWFLKFSSPIWKKRVKEAISLMEFYPDSVRTQFINTVDWLKDKACVRKSGMGAKLPWDQNWIVETLSDSVIYMAYYTISHIIKENKISENDLDDKVFDYVFLHKGIGKNLKIKEKILNKMREEFEYFYPVDIRFSGKDLIQNHLTFYLFHHVAIWEKNKWPKSIAVNGYVNLNGLKMSKRLGNVIKLNEIFDKYGADILRLNLVSSNENMDDANWKYDVIDSFNSRMIFLMKTISNIKLAKRKEINDFDKFLLSRNQIIIDNTTRAFENTKFRSAIKYGFFQSINDLKLYIERCGGIKKCNGKILKEVLHNIIKINTPIMPHLSEELWQKLKQKGFISLEKWPKPDEDKINKEVEFGEKFITKIINDINQIEKISGIKPKKAFIIIAPKWKFYVFKIFLENKNKNFKTILKKSNIKNNDVVKYIQYLQKNNNLLEYFLKRKNQIKIINDSKEFIENKLSIKLQIEESENSKILKAKNADINKPVIFLE